MYGGQRVVVFVDNFKRARGLSADWFDFQETNQPKPKFVAVQEV